MASLDSTFRALIERIKTRYTLGYYTSANGAEGKPHKLEVRLASVVWEEGARLQHFGQERLFHSLILE